MLKAVSYLPAPMARASGKLAHDVVVLLHDERRLRRKLIRTVHDEEVLVDLAEVTTLNAGDALVLADGRLLDIQPGEEKLYEVRPRDRQHLLELCWHLGNRHLPVQVEAGEGRDAGRVLILRDHVIGDMLVGLGAAIREVNEPFSPLHGAYHAHAHGDHTHALLAR